MVSILITCLVVALVVGLCFYVVDALPVPPPLGNVVKIVAMVIGVLIIVMALLGLAGYDVGWPPARRL